MSSLESQPSLNGRQNPRKAASFLLLPSAAARFSPRGCASVMVERVQDRGLSAGMSEFSKEHGDVAGSRRVKQAKRDTQFRGVHRNPSGRYGARIWVPSLRANVHVGTFDTAEEAAKAYDAAAVELRICAPAKAGRKKQASAVACTTPAKKKRAPARPDAWTEFHGVYQMRSGKYGAQIKHPGANGRAWLGTFHAAEDAARAYDEAAVKLRGARAVTNFKQPRNDKDAAAETMKKAAARQNAQTKVRGVYQAVRGKFGAQVGSSKTWLGTFSSSEEAARASDAAAVGLLGAGDKTNVEQPPTSAAAEGGEESPMDFVNGFPEMPAIDFLSNSFVSGAQLDDLWADSPPAEIVDEFIKDTDFSSDVAP